MFKCVYGGVLFICSKWIELSVIEKFVKNV